nr:LamG-like jellyroll fold domain-containing protein [uncultured Carboxylicivirga sp.]
MNKLTFYLILCWLSFNLSAQTAINFEGDAVRTFIMGNNNASLNISNGTLEAWIKTSDAGSGYRGIIVKHYSYGIYLLDNKLVAYSWDGSFNTYNTDITLSDNVWHHVAFSFQDNITNGSKLFIDGYPVLTFTYSVRSSQYNFVVGQGTDRTDETSIQHFNGIIDQVRVWNTARTEEEILENYKRKIAETSSELVLLWQFEEGSGNIVLDSSENNNDGTLYNINESNWVSGYPCSNSAGLMAHYSFNGDANDSSGNDHHGTVYGAILTPDRDDNANCAYYFDGIDDYIDLGDWENGGAMSITFWARWDDFNNYSRVIDLANGSSNANIIVSNYQTAGKFFFQIYSTSTKGVTSSSYIITASSWDFYSATVSDNGVMRIYKNGVLVNELTNGVVPAQVLRTKQYVARSNFLQDGYFKGAIDDIRIFNHTLSEVEISAVYNEIPTSIEESTYNSFKVFPNPVKSTLYFNQLLKSGCTLSLFNITGKCVFSKLVNENTNSINLDQLSEGIYLLKIQSDDGEETLKIVKN